MKSLWRHKSIHVHLLAHMCRWLTRLEVVRLHRVSGLRSHHARMIRIPLHHLWVNLLHLAWMKRRWRRRSSLLFFLDGDTLDNGPHPSFTIALNFPKRMVLRQVVAHTTLPSICAAFEDKIRILSLDSSVNLGQGHLTRR
jgi:hypothetical protein